MEIRRCDKCGTDLEARSIQEVRAWHTDYDNISIRACVIIPHEIKPQLNVQAGLDDQDEFGGSYICKDIDLCKSCARSFAECVGSWLK
jgi:hypothetical protein